jgi:hypothetical protein
MSATDGSTITASPRASLLLTQQPRSRIAPDAAFAPSASRLIRTAVAARGRERCTAHSPMSHREVKLLQAFKTVGLPETVPNIAGAFDASFNTTID